MLVVHGPLNEPAHTSRSRRSRHAACLAAGPTRANAGVALECSCWTTRASALWLMT